MPIYSASQILGRTVTMDSNVNYYRVSDINSIGDKAPPAGQLKKGQSVRVDSYLSPTPGYTNMYSIVYAPRKFNYFTFYSNGTYFCFRLEDNAIDTRILKESGALTLAQELEERRLDNMTDVERFFSGFNIKGGIKTIVTLAVVIAVVWAVFKFIIPAYKQANKK